MPASISTLPSEPVRTAMLPPEPSNTLILFRRLCVTIGDTAALSLMRLTRPRASAKAWRGVSQPLVAAKAAPPTQHRQKPRRDNRACFEEAMPSSFRSRLRLRLCSALAGRSFTFERTRGLAVIERIAVGGGAADGSHPAKKCRRSKASGASSRCTPATARAVPAYERSIAELGLAWTGTELCLRTNQDTGSAAEQSSRCFFLNRLLFDDLLGPPFENVGPHGRPGSNKKSKREFNGPPLSR